MVGWCIHRSGQLFPSSYTRFCPSVLPPPPPCPSPFLSSPPRSGKAPAGYFVSTTKALVLLGVAIVACIAVGLIVHFAAAPPIKVDGGGAKTTAKPVATTSAAGGGGKTTTAASGGKPRCHCRNPCFITTVGSRSNEPET